LNQQSSTLIVSFSLFLLLFLALQELGSIMSFCPASLLFKKSFNNIEPSTWHEIYSHEYDNHDIHCQVAKTTVSLYQKLSDPKKLHNFIKNNSRWGFLILNEDNDISLVHSICGMIDNKEYVVIIGNELLSSLIRIKIGDLAMSKQWFLEEELTKHLVDVISISGYYDDEEPLPIPDDDDITSYKQALVQRKYSFAPSKAGKMMKTTPGAKEGATNTTTTHGNGITFRHYFLVPPILVHVLLQSDTGSSLYPSCYDIFSVFILTISSL
jgi:hypothetical protein